VVHGHLTADLQQVLSDDPDYLLYGHSHIPRDAVVGGVRRICPGALYRADDFTAALLDPKSGELRWLTIDDGVDGS
jgi:hypothetical protein